MAFQRIAVLMLLTCSLWLTSQANANILQGVRFGQHGPLSRVVFDLQQEASYRLETTTDPFTIRIVFPGLSLAPNLQSVRARDALIQEVRFRTTPEEVIGDIVLKQPGTLQRDAQMSTPPRVVLDIAQRKDGQPKRVGEGEPRRGGDKETTRQKDSAREQREIPAQSQQTKAVPEPRTTDEAPVNTPQAASRTPQAASIEPAAPLTPTQLLERAEKQWAAQQIDAAQRSYTTFLQRYPEHPNNHLIAARLADTLRTQEHYREALEAYTAVLQGYPGSEGAIISQIRLAELGATWPNLLPPGDEPRYAAYRRPLQTLRRLASDYAFSPLADLARFKIGAILAQQNDLAAALETFQPLLRRPLQEALRRDVESGLRQTLVRLLADYQGRGAFLDVLRTFFVYKPSLSPAETGHAELLYPVVTSYAQLGLFDEAQSLLPKLLEAASAPPRRAHMALALAMLFAKSARPEVVTALLTPVEQFTDAAMRGQAVLLLSASAWQGRRPNEVVRYGKMGEDLLTAPAERTKFFTLLGQAYEAQGEPTRAVQAFRKCAEVPEAGEGAAPCLLRAAALYTAQGQHPSALTLYERVLHLFPNSSNAGLLFRLAESYGQQTDTAQTRATFTRLRESTQDAFWHKVASEYLEQAQWQERLQERLAVFQNTLMR